MPATGRLIGTPASMSASVPPQTRGHAGGAVRLEDLGDEPDRVGETRGRRDDRLERALGEHAVADFAAARPADRLALADRVGREVVVEEELLRVLVAEPVDLLLVGDGAERGGDEPLRFAALEERGAVRPRQDADLAGDVAQFLRRPAVDARAAEGDLAEDALADGGDGRRLTCDAVYFGSATPSGRYSLVSFSLNSSRAVLRAFFPLVR